MGQCDATPPLYNAKFHLMMGSIELMEGLAMKPALLSPIVAILCLLLLGPAGARLSYDVPDALSSATHEGAMVALCANPIATAAVKSSSSNSSLPRAHVGLRSFTKSTWAPRKIALTNDRGQPWSERK
jgi:hypothetical protein